MNSKIPHLKAEIQRLTEEKAEREASIPAHSIRAHQLMKIEELEEEICGLQDELKSLEG